MLTPIVSFFSQGETKIINEISKYEKDFATTIKNDENEKVDTKRNEAFKKNLDKNCEKLLEEEFKGREFKSNISCNFDLENMKYSIDKVEIGVKDGSIKKIPKIEINTSDSSEVISRESEVNDEEVIKIYLEQVLNIKAENIKVYKIE